MPALAECRIDAWTKRAAEPAVRATERALVVPSSSLLADTLAVSTATAARRRLAHVLNLKARAEVEPNRRDAYHRAADDLRNWAAAVYLATLDDEPGAQRRPFEDGVAARWRSEPVDETMDDEATETPTQTRREDST